MAFKFALLAALCVAQAFAFTPSSELTEEEIKRAVGNEDLKIVMGCFLQQRSNVELMAEKAAEVAKNVIEGVDDDIREAVAEKLKQTEEPVARIGVTLMETHRNMYIYLNRLNIAKAHEALLAGVQTIEGIEAEIRAALNEVKVKNPELADAMDWYMRYLSFSMDVTVPKIRRDYGDCLFKGKISLG